MYLSVCLSVYVSVPCFFEHGKNQKKNKKLKGEGRGERRGGGKEARRGKEKKSEDASLVCLPNLLSVAWLDNHFLAFLIGWNGVSRRNALFSAILMKALPTDGWMDRRKDGQTNG